MENKETVYDERIAPLMRQIIDICKENQIPMFAHFQYGTYDFVTTSIPQDGCHMVFEMLNGLRMCAEPGGMNMDKFLLGIMAKYENKSSAMLKILGKDIPA